jgi:tRNA pseudouridine38-40 synthase
MHLQIRKMIGTAIAVFHGLLPRDVIPISLARHSRIVLPLAPPDGLILASNDFIPFRVPPIHQTKADIEAKKPRVVQNRENLPRLEMAEAIQQRVRNFCQDILMPEVVPLVSEKTPNWSTWMINLEKNVKIPESEMAYVRASWTEWREQNVRLRQIRNQIDEEWRDVPPNLNTFSNVVKAVDAQC